MRKKNQRSKILQEETQNIADIRLENKSFHRYEFFPNILRVETFPLDAAGKRRSRVKSVDCLAPWLKADSSLIVECG